MATLVSSAGGLLAMLNESRPELKLYALSNLNKLVDDFWPEISTSVPIIESLYEDEEFGQQQRQLDALLVSKGVPEQKDGKTCAFWIMRFMRDIVHDKNLKFAAKWLVKSGGSRYTQSDIDEVRTEWAQQDLMFTV